MEGGFFLDGEAEGAECLFGVIPVVYPIKNPPASSRFCRDFLSLLPILSLCLLRLPPGERQLRGFMVIGS